MCESHVMANAYGHPMANLQNTVMNAIEPSGLEKFDGQTNSVANIRRLLFYYLGNNNVVVGWHVGWTVTLIGVALPVSRVVDLGREQSV